MTRTDLIKLFLLETPRLIRQLGRSQGLSPEDIIQTAFERLLRADPGMIDDPRAYLARTVLNLAADDAKRATRNGLVSIEEDDDWDWPSDTMDPEEDLIERERATFMARFVRTLPLRERQALYMHKLKKLPHKEIAERLGVSTHSIPRYLGRALAKCHKALHAFEYGEPSGLKHERRKTKPD